MRYLLHILPLAVLLSACVAPEEPPEPVVNVDAAMEFLESGLRPEQILFPSYLFMEDLELHDHGRIPGTTMIGAGMKTRLGLATVRRAFSDQLDANGWTMDKVEVESKSFRMLASLKNETVEIRAVQGTGPTQIYLLYQPAAEVQFQQEGIPDE